MVRIFFISALLLLTLDARENPFRPVVDQSTLPISSNVPKIYTPLEYETFTLPNSARSVQRVIIEYQNLDGSIATIEKHLDKSIDWHIPITLKHHKKAKVKSAYVKKASMGFISFYTRGKEMKVKTKNKIIRQFMLSRPHRIVIDFARSSHFLSKKFTNFSNPYALVRVGNHKDYYRIVIELDGQYEYQLKEEKDGYRIKVQ